MGYVPIKPIPIKDRLSMIFLEYGQVDVIDGAFVLVDKDDIRVQIPAGSISCILLEPGTRVSHAACKLAAQLGTLLVWVGEAGVRLYAAGQPGGASAEKLLHQANLYLNPKTRAKVVRKMFTLRFNEEIKPTVGIEQMRGMEGYRVRELYKVLATQFGVKWEGRNYDQNNWKSTDPINKAISAANACLYGVCEAGILAAGYAPSIGFLHSGKARSFVFDIADLFKFETSVPAAFDTVSKERTAIERKTRHACRDYFRQTKILKRIIPTIESILSLDEFEPDYIYSDSVMPVIHDEKSLSDDGHRD